MNNQRGAVSIYLALLLLFIITMSALALNSVLVKQIKIANTIIASERAFYAATSGLEEGLYRAKLLTLEAGDPDTRQNTEDVAGSIAYDEGEATYQARAGVYRGLLQSELCAVSVAKYREQSRRVISASEQCNFN